MTNIPLGVFPLSENMLKDDRVAEYSQQMKEFYLALVELNCNIYITERVLNFPYDLFAEGRTSNGFFFPLMVKNFLQASILLITKVATDKVSETTTLPKFRNKLWDMVKPEHQQTIQECLKAISFDQKTRKLLEKARYIRNTRIAHFIHNSTQERLTLSEIKALRDELNALLQALSFEAEYMMLPRSYERQRSDVEWVIDSVARGSDLLNMYESDPESWEHRRQHLSDDEIRLINTYRTKFGLPEV
jgi:hypothetical protein